MGFPASPRPYLLTPAELVYALALNPYVVPDRTFAAFGSVTEPFLPETRSIAVEYMRSVWKYLRLPSQVSTKSILTDDLVEKILSGDPSMSVLVTVVTLRNRKLEPRAPDPVERLEAAGRAAKRGLKVSLFLRPIIPSLDSEALNVVRLAAESGVESVVIGSLRVTESILLRLKSSGVDVGEISRRLKEHPRGRRQVTVPSEDLKRALAREAKELGLRVFRTACEANTWSHGVKCSMCRFGLCNSELKAMPIYDKDVVDLLEYLGVRVRDVYVSEESVRVRAGRYRNPEYLRYLVAVATYRKVYMTLEN